MDLKKGVQDQFEEREKVVESERVVRDRSAFHGSSERIRVFFADDHPVLRDGLMSLIQSHGGMESVGGASDGPSALQEILRLRPDVVVMDVSMPELGGTELTARIQKECSEVKILAFTAHDDPACLQTMLEAGALGYVLKSADAEELLRAIETVASGGIYVDKAMSRHAMRGLQRTGKQSAGAGELSDREAEVLEAGVTR